MNLQKRLEALALLFIAGIALAGIATAGGAGEILEESSMEPVVVFGSIEGEAFQVITLSNEQMQEKMRLAEASREEFWSIAEQDPRIKEIINGKKFNISGIGFATADPEAPEEKIEAYSFLTLEVEGEMYTISINAENGTVNSVEKMPEYKIDVDGAQITIGPDTISVSAAQIRQDSGEIKIMTDGIIKVPAERGE